MCRHNLSRSVFWFWLSLALFFGSLFRSSRSFINMPDYTSHEIIVILRECRENYRVAARLYYERYPDRRHPTHTIFRIYNYFQHARQGQLVKSKAQRGLSETVRQF